MTPEPLTELAQYVLDEKKAGRITSVQATRLAAGLMRAAYQVEGWSVAATALREIVIVMCRYPLDEAAIKVAAEQVDEGMEMLKKSRQVIAVPIEPSGTGGLVN